MQVHVVMKINREGLCMQLHKGEEQLVSAYFVWLLLKRGGEDGFGTSWWIHQASFTQDKHGTLPPSKTWFSAEKSIILPASEENLKKYVDLSVLLELPARLNSAIGAWVKKSRTSRLEVLKNLRKLQKQFPVK